MNRNTFVRSFVMFIAAVALALGVVASALAVGKDDVMHYRAFKTDAISKLNAWTAAVNNRDQDGLAAVFTPTGLKAFNANYSLNNIADVTLGDVTHVNIDTNTVTVNFTGLAGLKVFNTWEFTLVDDHGYRIDGFRAIYDFPTTDLNAVTDISIDVRSGGQTVFSRTDIDVTDFTHVKLWNADTSGHEIRIYPAGVSIKNPTQMVSSISLNAHAGGEVWLAELQDGRYIVVTDGQAAGTILVGNSGEVLVK